MVGMLMLWGLAILAAAAALFALWRSFKMQKDLTQLKRDQYYITSRMKRIPEEIREAVQPVRVHLARIAAGGAVSPDLVLDGRLYRDVSAAEAEGLLEQAGAGDSDRILLVDVRTPREYAIRRVPGAKLVPFDELEKRYKQDIPEHADKVFVYCMGGERSRYACDFLSLKGYTNLYNIQDGLQGWRGRTEGEGQVSVIQIERKQAASPQ